MASTTEPKKQRPSIRALGADISNDADRPRPAATKVGDFPPLPGPRLQPFPLVCTEGLRDDTDRGQCRRHLPQKPEAKPGAVDKQPADVYVEEDMEGMVPGRIPANVQPLASSNPKGVVPRYRVRHAMQGRRVTTAKLCPLLRDFAPSPSSLS